MDEDVLRDVFGIGPVAENAIGDADDVQFVSSDGFVEGAFAAGKMD
jgi:hypothetical protein